MAAALAALNGEASRRPKSGDGVVESIRVLQVTRRGAVRPGPRPTTGAAI